MFIVALIGGVMFAGEMTASQAHREFIIVGLSGFVLFAGAIIYRIFSRRCVHCQRPLAGLFYQTWGSDLRSHLIFSFVHAAADHLMMTSRSNRPMKPTAPERMSAACLSRHPAVAYLFLVRPHERDTPH
jgi:hypothetical protein